MPNGTENPARTDLANIDIRGLVARLDRMRMEIGRSQSADMPNGLLPSDRDRIVDYISDYKAYWEYVQSIPIPDSPEAHGVFTVAVPDDSHIRDPSQIENEDLAQILYQCQVYRIEMVNSQSARLIQGFMPTPEGHPGDRVRFSEGIRRIENLVAYVGATQPSDRPESTPRAMPVPPGQLGT